MLKQIHEINGITIDAMNRTVTENGVTRPFNDEENSIYPLWEDMLAAHQRIVTESDQQQSGVILANSSESEMRAVTDQIILWCQDASAYLFGPRDENGVPLYGSLDIPTILALLQNGETAILNYKASEYKPDSLVRQYEWLIARSVQANTLMNLAALSR